MTLKILHLEDNPADAELVSRVLQRAQIPCDVQAVVSADAYQSALQAQSFDIILSDSGIPGYDGVAAFEYAQRSSPGTPFIVVSGSVEDTDIRTLSSFNQPAAHVSKSRLDQLAGVIVSTLKGSQANGLKAEDVPAQDSKYLISVIQALSLARDFATIMDIVRHAARKLLDADGATFIVREGDVSFYAHEDAIAPLWTGRRFAVSDCVAGWAMQNRSSVAVEDIFQDARVNCDNYRSTFVKSLLVTPIRSASPVGAIGVYWSRRHQATKEQVETLTALADSTAIAMELVDTIANLELRVAGRATEMQRRQLDFEILNRELEAFSYSVSHDLRAPLLTIDGFAHLLVESCKDQLTGDSRGYLSRISQATGHMKRLIDDLLALSKIVRAPFNFGVVDLGAMSREIALSLDARAPAKPVEFTSCDAAVRGDVGMVRMLLESLLSNAWKFTGNKASPTVEVGVSDQTPELTTFFIRDNGVGFDPRYCSNLFSPFHRLHTQEQFPGSGMGLAIARRIVNRHGGEIRAEAQLDQGAVFSFSLPTHLPALR